jgi:hypothetical protein
MTRTLPVTEQESNLAVPPAATTRTGKDSEIESGMLLLSHVKQTNTKQ